MILHIKASEVRVGDVLIVPARSPRTKRPTGRIERWNVRAVAEIDSKAGKQTRIDVSGWYTVYAPSQGVTVERAE
jgi:hypothetical protein